MDLLTYYGVDWLAEALVLIGYALIVYKSRNGWLVSATGSLTFVAFGFMSGSIAVILSSLVFLALNILGYKNGKPD